MELPSNGAIDRAGFVIRRAHLGEDVDHTELQRTWETVREFRASHALPMLLTDMALWTGDVGHPLHVSSRIRIEARIRHKLTRKRQSRLSATRDIVGCRVALVRNNQALARLQRVREFVLRRFDGDVRKDIDYVREPRPTGYRAHHIIIAVQGRRVEIQLRTQRQNLWAHLNERLEDRFGWSLKEELGPQDVREELRDYADTLAKADQLGAPNNIEGGRHGVDVLGGAP